MYSKSMIRGDIKNRAKAALSGHWGTAILIFVINLLLSFGFSALGGALITALGLNRQLELGGVLVDVSMMYAEPIILVLSLFIMVPLSYGMLSWYMSLAQDRAGGVTQIFSWFESGKKYGKSILIQINTFLRTILYLIPLYLLIVLMVVVLVFAGVLTYDMYSYYNPVTETAITALVILFSLLITACAILLGIFLLRYNLVPYLAIRNPDEKIGELFRQSIRMMKGHKGELFVFSLSYLGWMLLVPLTCGLAAFYVQPYYNTALTMFAFYVADSYQAQNGQPPLFGEDPDHPEETAQQPLNWDAPPQEQPGESLPWENGETPRNDENQEDQ